MAEVARVEQDWKVVRAELERMNHEVHGWFGVQGLVLMMWLTLEKHMRVGVVEPEAGPSRQKGKVSIQ